MAISNTTSKMMVVEVFLFSIDSHQRSQDWRRFAWKYKSKATFGRRRIYGSSSYSIWEDSWKSPRFLFCPNFHLTTRVSKARMWYWWKNISIRFIAFFLYDSHIQELHWKNLHPFFNNYHEIELFLVEKYSYLSRRALFTFLYSLAKFS